MKTIALAVAVLLAACGGGDEMAVPKPCAMWPVVVSAGVNEKIDYTFSGGAFVATVAPGTYYTPATLAAAVQAAMRAAPGTVTITAGVNDRIDLFVLSTPFVATVAAGTYASSAALAAAVEAALTVAVPNGWGVTIDAAGVVTVTASGDVFAFGFATGGFAAVSPRYVLGFGAVDTVYGASLTAASPCPAFGSLADAVAVVSNTGIVSVSSATAFSLLFATGANAATSARTILGFGAVDTASATSATAANQMEGCWFPGESVADDTGDLDVYERAQTASLAGVVKSLDYATRLVRAVSFSLLPPHKVFIANEGSTYLNEAVQRLFRSGWTRFRWFNDATDLATGTDYVLDLDTAKQLPRNRLSPGAALYSLNLKMRRFV
jgi:hypothetical protein